MYRPELCASILSADFARLADQVAEVEAGGASVVHVDVMDNRFVPNLTIGPPVVASLRKATKLKLDCHLMVYHPDSLIPALADAGADWVCVHYEAVPHLHRTLSLIAEHGMKAAVAINPATRVDAVAPVLPMLHHLLIMSVNPGFGGQKFLPLALEKLREAARMRAELGLKFHLEVDGGVDAKTVASVVEAGADLLVAGNAVFGSGGAKENAAALLQKARAAQEAVA